MLRQLVFQVWKKSELIAGPSHLSMALLCSSRGNFDRRLHTSVCHQEVMTVFDRRTKLMQKERAAKDPEAKLYDYLKEEVGYRLADRTFDIKRELKKALDLGCGRGYLSRHLSDANLEHVVLADISPAMLEAAVPPESLPFSKVVVDEEQQLPFDDCSLDLVISNLSLHWVNNLPGCLKEVQRILKRDGVFLASIFGGDTLFQLRSSLVLAELEREGGFASHVSPFTEIQDIGSLLNRAGFTMLTIDTDEITVGYPSLFELMFDLKGMAENNANINRKLHIHRDTLLAASAIYQEMYGQEEGVPATFQIIYMIGWKPDPAQRVSQSERGSAQISLKDIGKLDDMIKKSGMEGRIKFMSELSDDADGDKDSKK
ncbi:arginine-hydroxylase NDUFAF5, mitochondrial [Oratosquilla oratoria]|uniref:arginine-hydroxylase NDUFAF5, mitochondrial n=1 Tax=Oratosquilla oratoria TaxID=337810 RepID=UPI003F761DFA